jgi:hypothetical protein
MMTGNILANAGTPLMWAGAFHLLIGNLFIGILEGLLLGFVFKLPKWKSILLMIIANYFSAWVGYGLLVSCKNYFDGIITVYQAAFYLWMALFVAYLITLFLEWPFVWAAMKNQSGRLRKSIWADVFVQTASYALLAMCWYYPVSHISMIQTPELTDNLNFIKNKTVAVYYISTEDNNVYKMCLDGTNAATVNTFERKYIQPRLYLKYDEKRKTTDFIYRTTDFISVAIKSENEKDVEVTIFPSVLNETESKQRNRDHGISGDSYYKDFLCDLRDSQDRQWDIAWCDSWLSLTQGKKWTGIKEIRMEMETPFLTWYIRSVTALPGDEIVFQLGNQICVYSRPENKLALLVKGTSPIVFLKDPAENQKPEPQSSDSTGIPKESQ